jgi:adenylate cyclase
MNAASVREALERILGSPGFDASARNRRFLQYIVEETLAGRADRLKGLTIAIDVFGRDPGTFDAQHDPVVRISAAKLRRRLERYYLTAGREDPIRIDIPKGTYVPAFEEREQPSVGSPAPVAEPAAAAAPSLTPGHTGPRRHSPTARGLAIMSSAVLAVAATAWLWVARAPSDQHNAQAPADLQLEGPAVVVAPFENLSGTEAGRLLAGGLTQELITDLMRFQDLRVYAATSNDLWTKDPAGFSEQLQVAYEVKGSVLRAPDRIRVAVQLLELGSGRYVWSETYDRPP